MAYPDGHPDKHPIEVCRQGATPEQRIHWLELHLALLWDQVWWMALPEERRKGYEAEGFQAPLKQFYGRSDPWPC